MRLLVAVGLFAFASLVVGCSPPQPKAITNPTMQLKPLPPPGSPAGGGGEGKKGDGEGKKGRGNRKAGEGSKATHP